MLWSRSIIPRIKEGGQDKESYESLNKSLLDCLCMLRLRFQSFERRLTRSINQSRVIEYEMNCGEHWKIEEFVLILRVDGTRIILNPCTHACSCQTTRQTIKKTYRKSKIEINDTFNIIILFASQHSQ